MKHLQNSRDLDVLALCLVNEWHLLNLMRQFSGEDKEVCALKAVAMEMLLVFRNGRVN